MDRKEASSNTAGYSSTPPPSTSGNTTKGGSHNDNEARSEGEGSERGSIDFYEEEIRELQKKINASADEACRQSLLARSWKESRRVRNAEGKARYRKCFLISRLREKG